MRLPSGFGVGHATDRDGWTGCTVVLCPDGAVAGGEVRGGGPGARELDLLSPATAAQGVHALCLAGGSAFGLAAADGVVRFLAEQGRGHATPGGRVPLVAGAIVYDLTVGGRAGRPGPDDAYAACLAADERPERGSVGAGTGASVGKLRGPGGWTKGGVGLATDRAGDAELAALAVVNAYGEVRGEDGAVLAGVRGDGAFEETAELLRAGLPPRPPLHEATTLVCVMTDALLTKTDAWHVARAASGGVARAVVPCATAFDGDLACCVAGGRVPADPFVLAALAADAAARAVRDAVREATGAPGCPALRDLEADAATWAAGREAPVRAVGA